MRPPIVLRNTRYLLVQNLKRAFLNELSHGLQAEMWAQRQFFPFGAGMQAPGPSVGPEAVVGLMTATTTVTTTTTTSTDAVAGVGGRHVLHAGARGHVRVDRRAAARGARALVRAARLPDRPLGAVEVGAPALRRQPPRAVLQPLRVRHRRRQRPVDGDAPAARSGRRTSWPSRDVDAGRDPRTSSPGASSRWAIRTSRA